MLPTVSPRVRGQQLTPAPPGDTPILSLTTASFKTPQQVIEEYQPIILVNGGTGTPTPNATTCEVKDMVLSYSDDGVSWTTDKAWNGGGYPPAGAGFGLILENGGTADGFSDRVRINIPSGLPGGVSPCEIYAGAAAGHLYYRMQWKAKVGATFPGHPVHWKLGEFFWAGGGAGNLAIICLVGNGSNPLYLRLGFQNCADLSATVAVVGTKNNWTANSGDFDQTTIEFVRDQWYAVDARVKTNTTGNTDGWIKLFSAAAA